MTEILIILLFTLTIILWIWALIDIYKSHFKNGIFKIIWFIAVIIFPILGSMIYFQFKNKMTSRQRRKFEPNFRNQ
ncbi:PLDc N-terminal domain-containing protein [Christiangramia echinicola]|uniref:Phospholipase_D-nuclease N-terminal n=1 Tax=Christiangramia echinicola TaxID=279359 RepID=A0A1H1LA77_9FLAO|nr:PLDc N-terminal domain-containing protein [Christiangramia echinicola]SDR71260.1 Phospholipase_D-nuclease N-terminal [Christiangramia echinicola]